MFPSTPTGLRPGDAAYPLQHLQVQSPRHFVDDNPEGIGLRAMPLRTLNLATIALLGLTILVTSFHKTKSELWKIYQRTRLQTKYLINQFCQAGSRLIILSWTANFPVYPPTKPTPVWGQASPKIYLLLVNYYPSTLPTSQILIKCLPT